MSESVSNVHPPKCPQCEVEGVQYIVHHESSTKSGSGQAWFDIASCSKCGHVYGVFNKISHEPRVVRCP